jgi:protein TonB
MFEQSLITINNGKTRKAGFMASALIGQVVMVALFVIAPMIWPSVIPEVIAKSVLITAPGPPAPPPPPASGPPLRAVPRRKFTDTIFVPRAVPKDPPRIIIDEMPDAPRIGDGRPEVPGGIPCGKPGLSPCGVISGGVPGFPPGIGTVPPLPPPAPKKNAEEHSAPPARITMGGRVQEANILRRVLPAYPPLAQQAGVQGHVILNAVISKSGTIEQLTLLRGNPLLVGAAMQAVKQWVYKPTLLNDVPVEVETQIDVNFTLGR